MNLSVSSDESRHAEQSINEIDCKDSIGYAWSTIAVVTTLCHECFSSYENPLEEMVDSRESPCTWIVSYSHLSLL